MKSKRRSRCQYLESIPPDALPIPDFPNCYATPDGRIITSFGRIKQRRFTVNGAGYPICGLVISPGKMKFLLVHRIIAKLFVPGNHSLTVNHKDLNKLNPAASNLEWISFVDNHAHARQARGNWSTGVGQKRTVVATNPQTGERHEFESGKAAAIWVGNSTAAGNISTAIRTGRTAYGFKWAKADTPQTAV